jgi:glycosyltransferase involved in cell wall biosynthesis
MVSRSEILVCIPAYNESSVIADVISGLRGLGFVHILIINDGSSDQTERVAGEAGATVITHLINRGAGAASQTGMHYARLHGYSYVLQLDGDGQHYLEDADALIQCMDEGNFDLVIGSRFLLKEHEIPRKRILYNKISNLFTNWFCIGNFTDSQSGFRLLNRKAIEELQLTLDGFGYCSEMIFMAEKGGLRIGEVAIRVRYTEYSMSKGQSFTNGIDTALHLLYKFFFSRS